MAERIYVIDNGATRITMKAFKVWFDLGLHITVAWGGESIREVKCRYWWGTGWERRDPAVNDFVVQYFDESGANITANLGPPKITTEKGYYKNETIFYFWGAPRPSPPPLPGRDARNVRRVEVTYNLPGYPAQKLVQT